MCIKDTTIYIERKKITTNITKLLNIDTSTKSRHVTSQLSRGPLKVAQELLTSKRHPRSYEKKR